MVVVTGETVVEVGDPPLPTKQAALPILVIRAPSTLIFRLVSGRGVDYIINTGKELIFVRNRPLVHGKIFLLPNPTRNETVTNSAK